MSDMSIQLQWFDGPGAMASIRNELAPYCKPIFDAGEGVAVVAMPLEDARSIRQNAFMWAFVLKHISQQAKHGGVGATPDGWHLYYKRKFLGYEFKTVYVPGNKRPTVTKALRSTKKLSVKKMAEYLEKVMADAATEFGVTFPAMTWEEWRA